MKRMDTKFRRRVQQHGTFRGSPNFSGFFLNCSDLSAVILIFQHKSEKNVFAWKCPEKSGKKSSKIKLGLKQPIEQSENYLYLFQPTSTMLPQYLPWHVSFGKVLSDPVRVRTWEIPDGSIPTRQEPLLGDLNPCRSTQLLPKPTLANSSSTTQDVQIPHTLRTPDAHAPYLHSKP